MTGPSSARQLTQDEFKEIIDLVVAYTGREPDKTLVQTWAAQAAIGKWTYPEASRAIHLWASRRGPNDFLEPANVTRTLKAVRSQAAATFEAPVIPEGLSNADYPRWYRAQRDAHVAALAQRWGMTGEEPPLQLPPAPPPNEIGQRRVAGLLNGAFHDVPNADPKPRPDSDGPHRRSALIGPCPYCQARDGEPCTRSGANGRVRLANPHPARLNAQEAS
ncbi:MAG: hypothetical protein AVDCRST_MAG68-5137 [uncultured Gemmatimonadetes bacterium]|uniref:DNA-binding phage zinc finger domain-containing protein n=1 Tax=uncultured Gemmatimonadota bacterium TaxID=203437 RepID=A0A6J4MS34_9BACT|nr:MAG: hypothetical protein AVDCRST_MAG68-5137 [uncultured Gemmatimonadota bacterium]